MKKKDKNNIGSLLFMSVLVGLVFFNQYTFSGEEGEVKVVKETIRTIDRLDAGPTWPIEADKIYGLLDQKVLREERAEPLKPLPQPAARSALIYNLTEDKTIFAYNPDLVWPLASLSKLMTAIIAVEKIGLDVEIPITAEAVATPEPAGNFRAGEVFVVRDMIKSLFLVSSNDGAYALADFYRYPDFMALMNRKALTLNMKSTFFRDPIGLSDENISTANDIKEEVRYIYRERPELLYFSRQEAVAITDIKLGNNKYYISINELVGRSDFIGGKTGYTDKARGNLVSIFSRGQEAILIVVLGTEDRFRETEKLLAWFDEV